MGRPNPAAPVPDDGAGVDPDETTRADSEWPVAPMYQLSPEPDPEDQLQDEQGAIQAQPRAAPAFPGGGPAAAIAIAALALLLLLGAGAAWLITRSDNSSAAAPTPANAGGTQPQKDKNPASSTTTETATGSTSESATTALAANNVAVPDVVGLPASDAVSSLRDKGLKLAVTRRTSSRPAGIVLSQDPSAGDKVEPGAVVALEVSKKAPEPPAAPRVSLPRLIGTTAAAAKSRLRELGLHWSAVTKVSDRDEGTVIGQAPSPGVRIEKGKTVTLTVSSGPEQASVPDVTGLDEASARSQLEAEGFDVEVVDQPTTDPDQDGVVVGQDPARGADADKGSLVTITVARAG